jgi:flagellar basal body-associated protein FliL
MADEADKQQKPKPRSKRWIGILVASVLVLGTGAAGAVFWPRLMGHKADPEGDPNAEGEAGEEGDAGAEETGEEEKVFPASIEPIVVDVRDAEKALHHLKLGYSLELTKNIPKEELAAIMPRGRQAAIILIRSMTFEELVDSKKFPQIAKELNDKIVEAMGKKNVKRVLITDYVAQ